MFSLLEKQLLYKDISAIKLKVRKVSGEQYITEDAFARPE